MSLPFFLSKQLKKPKGILGFLVSLLMNKVNKPMYAKVLNSLTFKEDEHVLEIGIGNGKYLASIVEKVPNGMVTGIDLAPTMLWIAAIFNRKLVRQKKVQILKGNAENLSFDNETFDKIISLNTIYFWENPTKIASELFRVLKPNGQLLLAFNSKKEMVKSGYNPTIFKFWEVDEVENLLKSHHFTIVESSYEQFKLEDCYCVIVQKK